MRITDLLSNDGYIIVNKSLIKELGLQQAILLGELCAEYSYWERGNGLDDGWFYSTVQNVEEQTTFSDYQQRQLLKDLENRGLLISKQRGIPSKRYIYLNLEALTQLLVTEETKKQDTLKTKELDVPNSTEQPSGKFEGNNNKDNNNKNNNKFIPPTVDEVRAYCEERGNDIDAETFVDFYTSKGWMVGKTKMKDWKACVRTWERNHNGNNKAFSIYDL